MFETVAHVATSIREEHLEQPGSTVTAKAVDTMLGEQKMTRVELDLVDPAGNHAEVHVYEAYWAPMTEGQVTLRNVVSFLFRAGITGLRRVLKFRRTMFGDRWEYNVLVGTPIALFLALLAVVSLVLVNTVMSAVLAAKLTWQSSKWPPVHVINDLSAISAVLAVFLLLLGVTILLGLHAKRFSKEWQVPRPIGLLIWVEFALLLFALVASAILMTDALVGHRSDELRFAVLHHVSAHSLDRIWNLTWKVTLFLFGVAGISAVSKSSWLSKALFYVTSLGVTTGVILVLLRTRPGVASGASYLRWLWVWLLLWGVSWLARGFLVQYLGDVVVYVEPHRVDRFNALREKIRKTVLDTADAIYRAADSNGTPLYDRVVILAHSLGSVAAYDTLNALMRRDTANGVTLDVVNRTAALITFGSPLDKTAYLFSAQRASHLQEAQDALANAIQPLIQSGPRPPWINIHSWNDIISGPLDFYHVPGGALVENRPDEKATIPLVAHVEYWENPLLWKTVAEYLRPADV